MSTADLDFVTYRTEWPARFAVMRERLAEHLPAGTRIEHVGSTAVPGLASKDCVDVLVVAPSEAPGDLRDAVRAAGFEYRPGSFDDDPGRDFYRLVEDGHRVAHVHVLAASHPAARRMLAVRDLLRESTQWRLAYERVKTGLAQATPEDRGAYIAGKAAFMDELNAAAEAREQGGTVPAPAVSGGR